MYKIICNKIECLKCGDIIESKNIHDFKWCKCGYVAVDGGHDYLKRCFGGATPEDSYKELSLQEEVLDK